MTQPSPQTACLPRAPRQLPKWARRRTPFYVFLSGSIVTLAAAIVIALQQQLLSLIPFVFALIFVKLASNEINTRKLLSLGDCANGRILEVARSKGAVSIQYEYMAGDKTFKRRAGIDGGTVSARFGREIKAGDQVTVVFDPKNPRKSAFGQLAQSCSTGSAYDVCQ